MHTTSSSNTNDAKGGLKRSFEQMLESDFALYGMTEGVMQLDGHANVTCAIICGGWPSWAMGAEARGIDVLYVFTKRNYWSCLISI